MTHELREKFLSFSEDYLNLLKKCDQVLGILRFLDIHLDNHRVTIRSVSITRGDYEIRAYLSDMSRYIPIFSCNNADWEQIVDACMNEINLLVVKKILST